MFIFFSHHQELLSWSVSLIHKISCYGSKEHRQVLTDTRIIPPLIALRLSPDVACNAIKALGNIALDSSEQRDLVISEGAIKPILGLIKPSSSVNI